jgi:hypothetical protein
MSSYQHRSGYVVASSIPNNGMPRSSAFLLAAFVIPLLGILHFVRAPLVLPSLSVVALGSAAVIAFAAWWLSARQNSPGISLWDVSGAYAFVGFAAGMLSDPHQVVEFWFASEAAP